MNHRVYLKEQPTDELWLFRLGYFFEDEHSEPVTSKNKEIFFDNNKIWTFKSEKLEFWTACQYLKDF